MKTFVKINIGGKIKLNLNWLILSCVFLFPFFVAGFKLGNYPFSLFLIFFIFLSFIQIINLKYSFKLVSNWLLLICWFLATAIFRFSIFEYILSLISFIIVTFPLNTKCKTPNLKEKLDKIILFTFVLSILICFYQYFSFFYKTTPLSDVFPIAREVTIKYIYGFKFPRVTSAFKEPAHYSIYLITFYILIDNYRITKREILFKTLTILLILFTLSLKGIFLLIFYVFLKFIKRLIKNRALKFNIRIIKLTVFGILLIFIINIASNGFVGQIFESIFERIKRVEKVVHNNEHNSSEGVRINVVKLFIDYPKIEPFHKLIIGEGYSQHDQWIEKNVLHLFKRGKIHNTFVIIYISTGIIGLVLFLNYLLNLFNYHKIKFEVRIILLFFFFSSGYLILYINWFPIFLIGLYNRINEQ